MTTRFEELTEAGQLTYANAVEAWARSVREAHLWRESRRREVSEGDQPLKETTRIELIEHLDRVYAKRVGTMPVPHDFIDTQSG
jgi:hypothetical protein